MQKKRISLFLMSFCLLFGLVSCSLASATVKVEFDSPEYSVRINQAIDINLNITTGSDYNKEDVAKQIVYSSSDPSVATFVNGKLTGVGIGETTIKVQWSQKAIVYDVAKVVVKLNSLPVLLFEDVNPNMLKGTSQKIGYKLSTVYTDSKVVFESANKDVVTVSNDGTVKAVGVGEGTIFAYVVDGDESQAYVLKFNVSESDFAINYDLDGGVNSTNNPAGYSMLALPLALEAPTKTGYTFAGWYHNDTLVTEVPAGTTGEFSVTAKWEINTYKVTYDLDGGTNASANKDTFTILDLPVTLANPTKTNYEFLGWYMNDTQVTSIPEGTLSDVTVVAKWKLSTFNVTMNLAEGTWPQGVSAVTSYNSGTVTSLPTPTRTGYAFDGWYDENNAKFENISAETVGDLVLTAKWTATKYTINYDLDGGHFASGKLYADKEALIADFLADFNAVKGSQTTADKFADDSYGGGLIKMMAANGNATKWAWFIDAVNAVRTANGLTAQTVAGSEATMRFEIAAFFTNTHRSSWPASSDYTVQANVDSVVGAIPAQEGYVAPVYSYTIEEAVTLVTPLKQDYTFVNWVNAKGEVVTEIAKGTTGEVAVKATWKKNYNPEAVLNVTYNVDGGKLPEGTATTFVAKDGIASLPTPTKVGYTFDGWYSESDFATKVEKVETGLMKDVSVYAKWNEETYKIEYDLDGGTFSVDSTAPKYDSYEDFVNAFLTEYANYFKLTGVTKANFMTQSSSYGVASFFANETVKATWNWLIEFVKAQAKQTNYAGAIYLNNPSSVANYNKYMRANLYALLNQTKYSSTPVSMNFAGLTYETISQAMPTKVVTVAANPVYSYTVNTETFTLETPMKEGQTFIGWYLKKTYKDGDLVKEITKGTTGDIKVFARFSDSVAEIEASKITYVLNDGVNPADAPDKFVVGEAAVTLPTPTKAGYIFLGWTTEETSTTYVTTTTGLTEDVTFYAQWEKEPEYSITYEMNGGSWTTTVEKRPYENADEVAAAILKDFGLTSVSKWSSTIDDLFITNLTKWGWLLDYFLSVRADDSYNKVITDARAGNDQSGDVNPYVITGELKAFVEKNTVTYPSAEITSCDYSNADVRNKVMDFAPKAEKVEVAIEHATTFTAKQMPVTLAKPVLEGKVFWAWYTNAEFTGSKVTEITSAGNVTLYARFVDEGFEETAIHNISYEVNNGVLPEGAATEFDEKVEYTLPVPTKDDYTFLGWTTEATSTTYVTTTKGLTSDVKLYAQWKEDEVYTITYVLNDGSWSYEEYQGTYTSYDAIVSAVLADFGLTSVSMWASTIDDKFIANMDKWGWLLDYFLSVRTDDSFNKVISDTRAGNDQSGDVNSYVITGELKAFVEKGTVSYPSAGITSCDYSKADVRNKVMDFAPGTKKETVTIDHVDTFTEKKMPVALAKPVLDGKVFWAWYTDAEFTSAKVTEITTAGNVTLYARFVEAGYKDPVFHTVIYDVDNGILPEDAPAKYEEGKGFTLPVPTKAGFTFLGWSLIKGDTNYVTSITASDTTDFTVYANWKEGAEVISEIVYVLDGGAFKPAGLEATTYFEGKGVETLPTPVRSGYRFDGWFVGEEKVTSIATTATGKQTLTAHWTKTEGKTLTVGGAEGYATLAAAIEAATDGDIIVVLAGTYDGATINKQVTIKGPNYNVDPNTTIRREEAIFTSDLIIACDNVEINGVSITGTAKYMNQTGMNIANPTLRYDVVHESSVNATASDSNIAPFNFTNTTGFVVSNLVIEYSMIEQTSGRPMIAFFSQVENLKMINNGFYGKYVNYNDGIKTDNATEFGVRGNVYICGNTFQDYEQYVIWIRSYGAGNYVICNNKFEHCGIIAGSHAAATFVKCVATTSEKVTINVSYNTVNNGFMLLRVDKSGTALADDFATITANYNVMTNCAGTYYVKNSCPSASVDASYNYFGVETPDASKFLNVTTFANAYASATDVPSAGEVNELEFTISYDLAEGKWPTDDYADRAALVADLLKDLTTWYGVEVTADNVHAISESTSQTMFGFFDSAEFSAKWGWLKNYLIYCRTNDSTKSSGASYLTSNNNSYWRYEVKGFVTGAQWASWPYSADYSNEGFEEYLWTVCPSGPELPHTTKYAYGKATEIVSPVRAGWVFTGWVDADGNSVDGILFNTLGNLELRATWKEAVKPTAFAVTNIPTTGILRYETYQLAWAFTPENTYNQKVTFSSSDESIFTVTQKGVITAVKTGKATLKVVVDADATLNKEYEIIVYVPDYVEITYNTNPYVTVEGEVQLNAAIKGTTTGTIVWSSSDDTIATVDANGVVKGVKAGYVDIKAMIEGTEIFTTIGITVMANETDFEDVASYLLSIMNANSTDRKAVSYDDYNHAFYYQMDLGASLFLFENLDINTDYMRSDRPALSTAPAYICVHDTGNFSKTADAKANIAYFQTAETSIHFTVGNDGVFQGVQLTDRAAHAGDGVRPYELEKTTVKVTEGTPVVTLMSNGCFAINGQSTTCRPYNLDGTPDTTNYTAITYSGIRCEAGADGYYYLGKTYYNSTYQVVSNYGGNASSIGIETCVNEGTDYYLTMQRCAKLVASLMSQLNLTIDDVKMHNFFSGKNCAQLMKNNSRYALSYKQDGYEMKDTYWGEFLELVEIESKMLAYKDYKITFKSSNTALLSDNGRVVGHNFTQTSVAYTITIEKDGVSRTINSSVMIPGSYSFQ